jgi:hypothetical protein
MLAFQLGSQLLPLQQQVQLKTDLNAGHNSLHALLQSSSCPATGTQAASTSEATCVLAACLKQNMTQLSQLACVCCAWPTPISVGSETEMCGIP